MIGIVFGTFFVTILLALPLGLGMGIASVAPSLISPSFVGNMEYVLTSMASGLNSTPILAIPLFMLSGVLMTKGGISKKLFDVFALIVGERTAGIPCAVIITCLFYGAISGSGPATCAAVGSMTIPLLIHLGYDKGFAAAVVAVAAGLGVIIPPSIPFVMYGLFTGVSIADLFAAGIIPGCLISLCLMVYSYIYCKKNGEDKGKIKENYQALKKRGCFAVIKDGFWALLTPVIILGSIYGGMVTPTEAACISVVYALLVCMFIYRTIRRNDIWNLLREAVASYAPICILIGMAIAFMRILILLKATAVVGNLIASIMTNRISLLISMNILLLIIGMFMDVNAAVIVIAPILLPVAESMGIDGVHLGIVMTVNLAIGFVTPPFGVNLFVAAPQVNISVIELGRKAMPFIVAFVFALILITFVPALSLCLV